MKTLQFKTNINCGGCIAATKPFLDKADGVEKWSVDTANPNKILTVETAQLSNEDVIALVQKAGFKAEALGA
ncbi:copper chaperone [Chitinophaga skermanii]|uniref:Copper chaperone n=1 Tax=Chitinophaga skermanii TaxID=331697 RepID=A0A327R4R4_9BACT|nr:heavy-metal-associated domain-containing protein [Chitinophaga skermanii]RAJ11058.1 copper chaperone [Chitinophaga skermanii]